MVRELDDARPRPTPIAVGALIAVNAIVFGYEMILSGGPAADGAAMGEFVATWGLVPREFLREIADPGATRQVVWFTPISSMFLHGGLIHLASNLLYLPRRGFRSRATRAPTWRRSARVVRSRVCWARTWFRFRTDGCGCDGRPCQSLQPSFYWPGL